MAPGLDNKSSHAPLLPAAAEEKGWSERDGRDRRLGNRANANRYANKLLACLAIPVLLAFPFGQVLI